MRAQLGGFILLFEAKLVDFKVVRQAKTLFWSFLTKCRGHSSRLGLLAQSFIVILKPINQKQTQNFYVEKKRETNASEICLYLSTITPSSLTLLILLLGRKLLFSVVK